MRILVVEDEDVLADAIARGLRGRGMATDVVYDGQAALDSASRVRYDVIVLDRDLPLVHGDVVCGTIVAAGDGMTRILMLTASADVGSRVEGLTLGADDYLVKPFAFDELVARIHTLARRPGRARPPVLARSGVRLDPAAHTVSRDGRYIRLTPKEFAVLEVLLAADGDVVSNEELLERAWDSATDMFTNTTRVTIMTLRRKLGLPSVVETVLGCGYRIP